MILKSDPRVLSRREFLERAFELGSFLGASILLGGCAGLKNNLLEGLAVESDELKLARGFKYQTLIKTGDAIGQGLCFGDCADFLGVQYTGAGSGYLWVNHEAYIRQLVDGNWDRVADLQTVSRERQWVGGSLLKINDSAQGFAIDLESSENKRFDGSTQIPFSGLETIDGSQTAVGTLANCSGGTTDWGTFLSGEENYQDFYGEIKPYKNTRILEKSEFDWWRHFPLSPRHYGWVVEINPKTGNAVKHVSLGRFRHEGALFVRRKDNKTVVYMGEDRTGGALFKFAADSENSLEKGILYCAKMDFIKGQGEWVPLERSKNSVLQKEFKSQLDVLVFAQYAAELVGATPMARPEGMALNPKTGNVFVALTGAEKFEKPYGSILEIEEGEGQSPNNKKFKFREVIAGSPENGLACPDNLIFDADGNLWITTDVSEKKLGLTPYEFYQRNVLFFLALSGKEKGKLMRVAEAPADAEFTGPCFVSGGKKLLLSVQHPGSQSTEKKLTTSFPAFDGKSLPKSTVIAIDIPKDFKSQI